MADLTGQRFNMGGQLDDGRRPGSEVMDVAGQSPYGDTVPLVVAENNEEQAQGGAQAAWNAWNDAGMAWNAANTRCVARRLQYVQLSRPPLT